jgi:hypothetical protein
LASNVGLSASRYIMFHCACKTKATITVDKNVEVPSATVWRCFSGS